MKKKYILSRFEKRFIVHACKFHGDTAPSTVHYAQPQICAP